MGRISITTDCWTAVNYTNFICVTAHFIGKDWVLHKNIISFKKILSHKGDDIGESIIDSLKEWDLKKILCCTADNASANDGAIRYVKNYVEKMWKANVFGGKYLHMRCAAHILNLVVQDGLEDIGMSVRRVREAVRWIRNSVSRLAIFQTCVEMLREKHQIHCKQSLCGDIPTRWNSTYLMLEAAHPYEEAFKMFGGMQYDYVDDLMSKKYNDVPLGPPTSVDWFNVRKMSEYLKKFFAMTLIVSKTAYVTSHLLFVELCDIFDLISTMESNGDPDVEKMARKMRLKIGKYWCEQEELNPKMNRIIHIAASLDPRKKLKHVEKCFKCVYGLERASKLIAEVRESVQEMFVFYKKENDAKNPTTARTVRDVVPSQGRSDHQGALSLHNMAASDDEDEDELSELTLYRSAKPEKVSKEDGTDTYDILGWWRRNGPHFPILSNMAKDILVVPVSSVVSECAFSTGGRVLCAYRSSLVPKMVEALICSEDWLKSRNIPKQDEEGVPEEELESEFARVVSTLAAK